MHVLLILKVFQECLRISWCPKRLGASFQAGHWMLIFALNRYVYISGRRPNVLVQPNIIWDWWSVLSDWTGAWTGHLQQCYSGCALPNGCVQKVVWKEGNLWGSSRFSPGRLFYLQGLISQSFYEISSFRDYSLCYIWNWIYRNFHYLHSH